MITAPFIQIKEEASPNANIGWVIAESSPSDREFELQHARTKIVDRSENGKVTCETVFQEANVRNRNGRFYDDKDLFPELVSERTQELLRTGFGNENGHPMSSELNRQATIDPNNVVAYTLKFWTEGNYICGYYKPSNLPIGKALNEDILEGYIPAWSLRALGSVVNTGRGAEVKGIKLITYDRVFYPSHKTAYTKTVTESGMEYCDNGSGILLPVKEMTAQEEHVCENGIIKPFTNKSVMDYIRAESLNYKKIVETFDVFYDGIQFNEDAAQVMLSNSTTGNTFVVKLENFISDEIMNYCAR